MPDNKLNPNSFLFSQLELIRRLGINSDGICGGVVLAYMAFFYKTNAEVLSSTYTNFFTKRADPILDLALSAQQMQMKFGKCKGSIKTVVEETFFNSEFNGGLLLNEIDQTLEFYRQHLDSGTSVICTEIHLICRESKETCEHLVGLLNFKDLLLFIEPNHGYYFFKNFEEFTRWYKQECAIGGILAYTYKDPADTDPTKRIGLAKDYIGTRSVSYGFNLTEKREFEPPRSISSRIQTMPSQPITAKL